MIQTLGVSKIRRTPLSTPDGPKVRVTVRLRPLSLKELAMSHVIAWDCINQHTIIRNNPNHEDRETTYTFDKVFTTTCSIEKVYEEGAKDVVLSALTGMNATIFAYGQTSSGTMRGITEYAVKDIYEHIRNHQERDFVLRVSAFEIYNEIVVDLLKGESGSLRLLDDPEKGTIVEKLVEEVVKDGQDLQHLISICEDRRQVGDQIIRLTIESNLQETSGCVNDFIASLNLVDLAESECASQTNTDGTRMKEGSHLNRSLLALTEVIRKLSEGKRSGQIPYRDSKLTRILQSSLGGNARTAIICTMSPALSHVEETRNTLLFATNAKEVTNNAQVKMVVKDKRVVKHFQKETARVEAKLQSSERQSSEPSSSSPMEIDLKEEQLGRNIKIAIIDSGINHQHSCFLREERVEEFKDNIGAITLNDTIIAKASFCCKSTNSIESRSDAAATDFFGHGSQCAAVAAGRRIEVNLCGVFPIIAEGAAPNAEIYSYKVAWRSDTMHKQDYTISSWDIEEAFQAAIQDKVDVISVSISEQCSYVNAVSIGSFNAMKNNILTVACAGNYGPNFQTVTNVAPWILTVGACHPEKTFKSNVIVGNKVIIKGHSLNTYETNPLPIIDFPRGEQLVEKRLRHCLDGKLVLCDDYKEAKLAKSFGASGVLYTMGRKEPYAKSNGAFPSVWIDRKKSKIIKDLLKSSRHKKIELKGEVLKARLVDNNKAFKVVDFSGRGPNPISFEILKPDLFAVGVEVCVPTLSRGFALKEGTSFACPYVAAKAALIKRNFEERGLNLTCSAIKSALITTASNPNDAEGAGLVDPYEVFATGAGLVNPSKAMNPGLIFDCDVHQYVRYLFAQGCNEACIQDHFGYEYFIDPRIEQCQLNHPSISILVPKIRPTENYYFEHIKREARHIGSSSCNYTWHIQKQSSKGVEIYVKPDMLQFPGPNSVSFFEVAVKMDFNCWTTQVYSASLIWSGKEGKEVTYEVKIPLIIIRV